MCKIRKTGRWEYENCEDEKEHKNQEQPDSVRRSCQKKILKQSEAQKKLCKDFPILIHSF